MCYSKHVGLYFTGYILSIQVKVPSVLELERKKKTNRFEKIRTYLVWIFTSFLSLKSVSLGVGCPFPKSSVSDLSLRHFIYFLIRCKNYRWSMRYPFFFFFHEWRMDFKIIFWSKHILTLISVCLFCKIYVVYRRSNFIGQRSTGFPILKNEMKYLWKSLIFDEQILNECIKFIFVVLSKGAWILNIQENYTGWHNK